MELGRGLDGIRDRKRTAAHGDPRIPQGPDALHMAERRTGTGPCPRLAQQHLPHGLQCPYVLRHSAGSRLDDQGRRNGSVRRRLREDDRTGNSFESAGAMGIYKGRQRR